MSLETLLISQKTFEERLVQIRRNLHEEPELSNEEVETTRKIRNWLEAVDIRILDLPLRTGIIGEISGQADGPIIAIRADIDALPIQEQTDLPFQSKVPGVMHACGHDFHTTVILGAAYLLKKRESQLKGSVRILFQPAEETGHGAKSILATDGLKDVEAIFGLHNNPHAKVGTLGTKTGILSAGVDRFDIKITGNGAHAARPHEGIDPIIIAADIVSRLQNIVSREIKSSENVVISVTQIHAGNTWNIIPEAAYLGGTVRTLNQEIRDIIPEKIEKIIKGAAYSYGAEAELEWHPGPPSVNNDEQWTEFAKNLAEKQGFHVVEVQPSSGGEDFAFYQQKIKGTFVNVGVSGEYGLHNPKFTLDETAIVPSANYFAELAEQALISLSKK